MNGFMVGDHVRVWRGPYWHHGVIVDRWGQVAHYADPSGNKSVDAAVRVDSLHVFAKGAAVEVVARVSHGWLVAQRALTRVGERRYSLLTNNCEHFATWAQADAPQSTQVAVALLAVVGLGLVACAR